MPVIDAERAKRYRQRLLASLRAHWRILPVYCVVLWAINFLRVWSLTPDRTWLEVTQISSLSRVDAYWLAAPFTYFGIALVEALQVRG